MIRLAATVVGLVVGGDELRRARLADEAWAAPPSAKVGPPLGPDFNTVLQRGTPWIERTIQT
jgi:hypothetical protein